MQSDGKIVGAAYSNDAEIYIPDFALRANSRSRGEVWLADGGGAQDAAGVFGGHGGGEVGGGFVVGFWLMAAPVHAEAVGQAGEDAVDPHGIARAQPALVVAARDVEPRVEAVLDVPMLAPAGQGPGLRRIR